MEINYFELIGEENLRKLIKDFYLGIADDDLIRPMYVGDLAPAEERLFWFMQQYLGGPTTYNERRGAPKLKRRHVPFRVDKAARDRWVDLMNKALEKNEMPEMAKFYLTQYFEDTATFLLNRGEK